MNTKITASAGAAAAPAVVLIGPMGSGKSTVGKELAAALNRPFLDLDEKIVRDNQLSIPEIFARFQESGFRDRESQALAEALEHKQAVVASGGGIILREQNRLLLKEKAFTIYLYCDVQTQFERTRGDNNRPMIYAEDRKARLTEIFTLREPWYLECADLRIDSGKHSPQDCVQEILQAAGSLKL